MLLQSLLVLLFTLSFCVILLEVTIEHFSICIFLALVFVAIGTMCSGISLTPDHCCCDWVDLLEPKFFCESKISLGLKINGSCQAIDSYY